jgi:hypothetical protein
LNEIKRLAVAQEMGELTKQQQFQNVDGSVNEATHKFIHRLAG